MIFQRLSILFLHIPDGFLSAPVSVVGWILAFLLVGIALRQSRTPLEDRRIPLVGVMAAFIFAAQTINFPVTGGTSGHLLGGALVAIMLGPWTAILVMTAVVVLQALLFQDGGLLVMGWNIFNMAVLTTAAGAVIFGTSRRILGDSRLALILGGALAAWISVELAALATAVQLAASGTVSFDLALLALTSVHALIGVGEAVITVAALLLIWRVRPDLFSYKTSTRGLSTSRAVMTALVLSSILAVALLSLFASDLPDGLERAAVDLGFVTKVTDPLISIFPGYVIPFLENQLLAALLAVFAGTLIVFGLVLILGRLFIRNRRSA